MRRILIAWLLLLPIIASILPAAAQEKKPPNSARQTLEKWIAGVPGDSQKERDANISDYLGRRPYAKVALPVLIEALEDSWCKWRLDLNSILADYGSAAVPRLIEALKRPESAIRFEATEVLGSMGPIARIAVPALLEATRDSSSSVRRAAMQSLANVAPKSPESIQAIVSCLADKNHAVRTAAAKAAIEMGPHAAPTVPALIRALGDNQEDVVQLAAKALGKIGPEAKAAVPALIQGLKTNHNPRPDSEFGVLINEFRAAFVELVTGYRERDYSQLNCAFVSALAGIGPPAKDAVPTLIEALKEDMVVRESAAMALRRDWSRGQNRGAKAHGHGKVGRSSREGCCPSSAG